MNPLRSRTMFSVNVLRRLRPAAVSHSFSYIHTTAARHGAPLPGSRVKQLPAAGGSSLQPDTKIPSRVLSAQAHSEDGKLIYTGRLGVAIRGVKMFSYSTSGASLLIMPQVLLKTGLGVSSLAMQATFCGVIGVFTFITPILLHLITKGYVVRLYHHPDSDTYTAITYSVFLTEKKRVFHQSQVKIPAINKMFTTFSVDNMGLLVNPDLFTLPQDYNHLMGYDKPFSFSPDDVDSPERS